MGAILEPGRSKSSRPWGALLQGACGASALRMAKASACAALHIDTCGRSEAQSRRSLRLAEQLLAAQAVVELHPRARPPACRRWLAFNPRGQVPMWCAA